jgi:hypothetical protein
MGSGLVLLGDGGPRVWAPNGGATRLLLGFDEGQDYRHCRHESGGRAIGYGPILLDLTGASQVILIILPGLGRRCLKPTDPATKLDRRLVLSVSPALGVMAVVLGPVAALAQLSVEAPASWNDGTAMQAILDFVRATNDRASPNYVPPEDRIATFDQDGTVWAEHPLYTQAMFALDRMHEMAPRHPEWRGRYLYMYTTISGNSVIRSDEAKASP